MGHSIWSNIWVCPPSRSMAANHPSAGHRQMVANEEEAVAFTSSSFPVLLLMATESKATLTAVWARQKLGLGGGFSVRSERKTKRFGGEWFLSLSRPAYKRAQLATVPIIPLDTRRDLGKETANQGGTPKVIIKNSPQHSMSSVAQASVTHRNEKVTLANRSNSSIQ